MFSNFSILILIILHFRLIYASPGDQLESYRSCIYFCVDEKCDADGYSYLNDDGDFTLYSFFKWPCFDECKYNCMWETVQRLEASNVSIPQFHGKWPFVRILGIQEPASTFFSLLNLILHFKWIRIFRRKVSNSSPLYWLWHIFAYVCIHAWIWSVIFHARDTPLTEFMDYAGAFSIILVNCYVLLVRTCWTLGKLFSLLLSVFFFLFYVNHALYLYASQRIDYNYNMIINFSIAIFSVTVWLLWCFWNRNSKPYVGKCATYVISTSMVALLEIIDKPPLFYIFDSHSIWHLSTAFLIGIFYRFAIHDCNYLKRQKSKNSLYLKKL